jgi:hypothetical protein
MPRAALAREGGATRRVHTMAHDLLLVTPAGVL